MKIERWCLCRWTIHGVTTCTVRAMSLGQAKEKARKYMAKAMGLKLINVREPCEVFVLEARSQDLEFEDK